MGQRGAKVKRRLIYPSSFFDYAFLLLLFYFGNFSSQLIFVVVGVICNDGVLYTTTG